MNNFYYGTKVWLLVAFLTLFPIHIFLIKIKNFLYDYNFWKAKKSKAKVISVGNLSLGGSGKTPFTIALSRFLVSKNYSVGIVTTGHGRKNNNFFFGESFLMENQSWEEAGDEAVLLKNNLKDVPVYVSWRKRNKAHAANYLSEKSGCDIVILDDAFQHRKTDRDIDIVLTSSEASLDSQKVFPYGLLREPVLGLKRADMIIETKGNLFNKNSGDQNRFVLHWNFNDRLLMPNDETCAISVLEKYNNILSLCAIGDPESFKKTLELLKIDSKEFLIYPDHYPFKKRDVHKINQFINKNGVDAILCTEKDLIKLKQYKKMIKIPVGAITINYSLNSEIEKEILLKIKEVF